MKKLVKIPLIKIIFKVEKSFSVILTEYFTIVSFIAKLNCPSNINNKPFKLLLKFENIFILIMGNLVINIKI